MIKGKNVTFNVNGGQVNLASDNSTVNVNQNNGINENELDNIIKGIMNNLSTLKKEDADEIVDIIQITKEELEKAEPKVSRLKNCINLIAPMFTIVNGIPSLVNNLQKLADYITRYIH